MYRGHADGMLSPMARPRKRRCMPVIRDIPLSLKTKEVLRRQGFRGHSKIRPEITNLILELLASVESAHLLEPAAAYEIHPITEMSQPAIAPQSVRQWCRAFHYPHYWQRLKSLPLWSALLAPSWKNRQQTTSAETSLYEVRFWMASAAQQWTRSLRKSVSS